ncbi:MAG: TolC family protein [Thiohalomonadaceae bacterium]
MICSCLCRGLLLGLVLFCAEALALPLDPFVTETYTAVTASRAFGDETAEEACNFAVLSSPLGLTEAIERALCQNPKVRSAWSEARAQAALLGVARSAYLPTISADVSYHAQKSISTYDEEYSVLDEKNRPRTRSSRLRLDWMLFDFGMRSANTDQASALLEAANASHDLSIQYVLLETAQAYFDVQTAQALLHASRAAEESARQSYLATEAKYIAGVGALTDKLQAAVALSDAKLKRVTAEGEMKIALGSLATAIGLSPDTSLLVPERDIALPILPEQSVADLIGDARSHHPALLAARAEVQAAEARVRATRAEGSPNLVLFGEASDRRQDKYVPISGYPSTGARLRDNVVGVQVNIPLFEGFGRSYKVRTANSQAAVQAAELVRLEQQVSLEVWKSYQLLNTQHEHIKAATTLLDSARRSFEVAQGSFRAGVGNILELLSAQSAVASAEQRRIEAHAGLLAARLKLAASIGRLGLWAIK